MKLNHVFGAFVASALLASGAFAAQNIQCTAQGRAMSNNGSMGYTDTVFNFALDEAGGLLQVKKLTGMVKANAWGPEMDPDNAYIGRFDTSLITENPNYKPTTYKGSAQFKDLDAVETLGAESGMWGNLILARKANAQGNRMGKYIFQAGDHIGGTIHMTCKNVQ